MVRRGAISSTALVGGLGLPFFVVSASGVGVRGSSCESSVKGLPLSYQSGATQRRSVILVCYKPLALAALPIGLCSQAPVGLESS